MTSVSFPPRNANEAGNCKVSWCSAGVLMYAFLTVELTKDGDYTIDFTSNYVETDGCTCLPPGYTNNRSTPEQELADAQSFDYNEMIFRYPKSPITFGKGGQKDDLIQFLVSFNLHIDVFCGYPCCYNEIAIGCGTNSSTAQGSLLKTGALPEDVKNIFKSSLPIPRFNEAIKLILDNLSEKGWGTSVPINNYVQANLSLIEDSIFSDAENMINCNQSLQICKDPCYRVEQDPITMLDFDNFRQQSAVEMRKNRLGSRIQNPNAFISYEIVPSKDKPNLRVMHNIYKKMLGIS